MDNPTTTSINNPISTEIAYREPMIYADSAPEILVIQLVERKEVALMEEEVSLIRSSVSRPFVMAGVPILDRCKELMPWNDPAVDRRPESGQYAEAVLNMIVDQLLPRLRQEYGHLPCIIGGYSLGGLFALWASTRCDVFSGVAAASPSVWISNWMEYASSHPVHAKVVYMSLGDQEEHVRNQHIKQVGDHIRAYHSQLSTLLSTNTILEWNPGNHFQDFASRTARAFAWVISRAENEK